MLEQKSKFPDYSEDPGQLWSTNYRMSFMQRYGIPPTDEIPLYLQMSSRDFIDSYPGRLTQYFGFITDPDVAGNPDIYAHWSADLQHYLIHTQLSPEWERAPLVTRLFKSLEIGSPKETDIEDTALRQATILKSIWQAARIYRGVARRKFSSDVSALQSRDRFPLSGVNPAAAAAMPLEYTLSMPEYIESNTRRDSNQPYLLALYNAFRGFCLASDFGDSAAPREEFYAAVSDASRNLYEQGYTMPFDLPRIVQALIDDGAIPQDNYARYSFDQWTVFFANALRDNTVKQRLFEEFRTPEWYSSSGYERYGRFFADLEETGFTLSPDATVLDIGSGTPVVAAELGRRYCLAKENIFCIDRKSQKELTNWRQRTIFAAQHDTKTYGGAADTSSFDQVTFTGETDILTVPNNQYDLVMALNSILPNTPDQDIIPSLQKAILQVKPGGNLIIGGGTFIQVPLCIFLAFQKDEQYGGLRLHYAGSLDPAYTYKADSTLSSEENRLNLYTVLSKGFEQTDKTIYKTIT